MILLLFRKISREKSTKRDRKRGRPTMDARPNEKSDTLVLEMEPVDANVIVHSTVCEPVLRPHPASAQKGKMKQRGQNSAQSGEEGQTKLGRVEARAFLRDVRPEAAQLPEDNQRPHVVSDLEPRMLVVGAEPRTYYADAEGAPTSHDEPLNLVRLVKDLYDCLLLYLFTYRIYLVLLLFILCSAFNNCLKN